ncbi:MAG TPA: DUF2268 domain-containing putative Zn-dependent protease [Thermoanaerobaculia bacterium]|nr:DUF2268 domain-containing putative Zn-dependent protease [Thermoanaerobaculia bacterium]
MRQALKRSCLMALLLMVPVAALAQSRDPDAARIVTEDIAHFWEAFDRAAPEFPPQSFGTFYLSRGTPGLKDFVSLRISNAEELARVVRSHPRYYASIRDSTLRIREMEPGIRASFYALKYLYPDAVFPDVFFLIGRLNSGGTVSDRGLLIGAEMHGRTPQSPVDELSEWLRQVTAPAAEIPHVVAHELIHFQQKYPESPVLLGQAIREGSADFLAELISGRPGDQHVAEFAAPREAELWEEFQRKMHGKELSGWLYSGSPGRPQDLGYWVGYKITKSYYDRAGDKRQAIREILEIKDFDAFLAKSGYAERFSAPVGVK